MLFSIITVCFNSAKTIRSTLDSVLEQEFTDYEYIIIDGSSQDGTIEIIREYEKLFHGRMRYVSEKDNGIYDAMNNGLKMAQGDYIGILNSDDYYEKTALKDIREAMSRAPGADVYYGIIRNVSQDGKERDVHRVHHSMLLRFALPHPTSFIRRNICMKQGGYDTSYRIAADYDLMLKIYLAGGRFCPVDRIITIFRTGGASTIKDNTPEHLRVLYSHHLISWKYKITALFLAKMKWLIRKYIHKIF